MAAKKVANDGITVEIPLEEVAPSEPLTPVYIPLPDGVDQADIDAKKFDPYEHVTINGKTTYVKRGETVMVPVSVFLQLRNRYPRI